MLSLEEIELALSQPESDPDHAGLLSDLGKHKVAAIAANDEALAKHHWCLEHTTDTQQFYRKAFGQLKAAQFYDAWCSLEQAELSLHRLRRHFAAHWPKYQLDFIEGKTTALQSLFPYRIFTSPEIIELEKRCNICNQVISLRNPCGHRVGEVYRGVHCGRIVTKCKIVGQSFVTSPIQKYSVPFKVDPKSGEAYDHYNYSTVKYLVDRWPDPYLDWHVNWTKAMHPKEKFAKLQPDDKCPCDSQMLYKECCMNREGIIMPHVEFEFRYPLPKNLQTIEFSY
jgi:hypothetical protein